MTAAARQRLREVGILYGDFSLAVSGADVLSLLDALDAAEARLARVSELPETWRGAKCPTCCDAHFAEWEARCSCADALDAALKGDDDA